MHIVIMAGGRGTRFWPQSRIRTPKQFLNIVGDGSMLRQTFDRVLPLAAPSNIWVVTSEDYREAAAAQIPELPEENIIAEPLVRSTAPCIGLSALHIRRRDQDAVMAVLPADHHISDTDLFLEALTTAAETARREQGLVTIGIRPTHPETGYGYIQVGEALTDQAYRVTAFTEKPDRAVAETFLAGGRHLWNSGMFIWSVSTILNNMQRYCPALYDGLMTMEPCLGTANEAEQVRRVYESLPTISIDYAVMEHADRVFVVKGGFGWSDVGSWSAVQKFWKTDENRNAVRGRIIGIDTSDSIIEGGDKLVALIGVEDLIVVDTPDVLLICRKDRDQDIKRVIEELKRRGMTAYL